MSWSAWRNVLLLCLAAMITVEPTGVCHAQGKSSTKKSGSKSKKKSNEDLPPINLPDDANEIVISYDPGVGAGQPDRKGEPPFLKIKADGSYTVTNVADGDQKSGKLTEKELQELLSFIVHDYDFLNLTAATIDEDLNKAAKSNNSITDVRGIGTSTITIKLADKQNTVSYRAAVIYHKKLPKATEIARFAEVEERLFNVATKGGKGGKPKK